MHVCLAWYTKWRPIRKLPILAWHPRQNRPCEASAYLQSCCLNVCTPYILIILVRHTPRPCTARVHPPLGPSDWQRPHRRRRPGLVQHRAARWRKPHHHRTQQQYPGSGHGLCVAGESKHVLLRRSAKNPRWTNSRRVLMRRPQLFHKRRCYSSQAKPSCAAQSRAATLRCGIGLQVGNSRRLGHLQRDRLAQYRARAVCKRPARVSALPGRARCAGENQLSCRREPGMKKVTRH